MTSQDRSALVPQHDQRTRPLFDFLKLEATAGGLGRVGVRVKQVKQGERSDAADDREGALA